MDRKEKIEVFAGGAFGMISIIAAFIEYAVPSCSAFAGCMKDVFGTLVVIVVLLASIKIKSFKIESILKNAVEDWGAKNVPLIFKIEEYVSAQDSAYSQGFFLLQEPKSYVSLVKRGLEKESEEWGKYAKYRKGGNKPTGKFIDMPSYREMTQQSFTVLVEMKQSHFSRIPEFQTILSDIIDVVGRRDGVKARPIGQSAEFVLEFDKIKTKADAEHFVNTLDYILSLVKVIA